MPEDMQGLIFDPVGRCIYCGSDGGEAGLRDEHIVPYSLNGNALLPASSCAVCEGITSYLDGYLARRIFYDMRLHTGAQSRTPKKKQPKTRPARLKIDGQVQIRDFVTGQHPFATVIPLLGAPGFVTGRDEATFSMYKANAFYHWPPEFVESVTKDAEQQAEFMIDGDLNLVTFARAIAKIGYCHAVAKGYQAPNADLEITRFIRGEVPERGPYLVGCDPSKLDNPPTEGVVMHSIQVSYFRSTQLKFLVVSVRLFANSGFEEHGMPTFLVCVDEGPLEPTTVHQEEPPH